MIFCHEIISVIVLLLRFEFSLSLTWFFFIRSKFLIFFCFFLCFHIDDSDDKIVPIKLKSYIKFLLGMTPNMAIGRDDPVPTLSRLFFLIHKFVLFKKLNEIVQR